MQDAPQHDDQTAPQSEQLDDQTLDHVAGGVIDGDIGSVYDDGTGTGCIPQPWIKTPWQLGGA